MCLKLFKFNQVLLIKKLHHSIYAIWYFGILSIRNVLQKWILFIIVMCVTEVLLDVIQIKTSQIISHKLLA